MSCRQTKGVSGKKTSVRNTWPSHAETVRKDTEASDRKEQAPEQGGKGAEGGACG